VIKVTTAKEMQLIDRVTIEKYGLAGIILMERAGLSVANRIKQLFNDEKVLVLCGGGNNGGDGFVIARELYNLGRDVEVFLSAKPAALKGDAKINYNAAKKFGVKIYPVSKFLSSYSSHSGRGCIIVDALLGTGLSKEIRQPLSDVVNKVNEMSCPVISVDIPSGVSSDTGQIMGSAVKAGDTVTFGLPKRGHFLYPGADCTGRLFIENIGFHNKLLESAAIRVNVIEKKDAVSLLPLRPKNSHKGTYGHVLLVAGSKGKTGAALMAAKACLRTGAGLVTIGVPETLVSAFQSRVTEEMILPLPDTGNGMLSYDAVHPILDFAHKKASVLAIGPGISLNNDIVNLVSTIVRESSVPMVIDADGINAIAEHVHSLKKSKAPVILTPHTGEMARLLSQSTEHRNQSTDHIRSIIEKERIATAQTFAKKTGACLVLKGVPTVVAASDGSAFINSTGNPGMATAGTGDVLTGMIAAFLAQKLNPMNAALLGVYMHGYIGDAVAEKKGEETLIASDIIKSISSAFKSIKSL